VPKIRRRGLAQGGELPGTLKRSSKEAQETFTKARDSAVRTYGEGDQADRAAYAEFKRKFEKRGDHWIPKRSADSGELALTSLGAGPSPTTKVPSMYEMERTSPGPGPTWPANRPSGTGTARRGRASARTAGFPAPPAFLRSPPDDARFQRRKHSYWPGRAPARFGGNSFLVFSASTFRPQKMPGYPHNTVLVHWFMHSPSTGSVDNF